ncbi:hypothetical protein VCHC64A1_00507A, partial [Vibrio cholerae HC-64A1]
MSSRKQLANAIR